MADHGHVIRHQQTGWVGWIAFAAVFMIIAGFFQLIFGLSAIFQNQIIVSGISRVWLLNLTTWGWVHFLLGALLMITGFGLMRGGVGSRAVAIILVSLSAIANFLFIPIYPIWSIIVLVIDALVIFAIVAHGEEVRYINEE